MSILSERGLFWWDSEPLMAQQFAPDSAIPGQLIINEHGLAHLELDGRLPLGDGNSPLSPFVGADPDIHGKSIRGILKGSNQHILLFDIRRSGVRFSNAGMNYEQYSADNCMVGDIALPQKETLSRVTKMRISLDGFEEWLGLRSIEVTRADDSLSASYRKPPDEEYSLSDGRLSICYFINAPLLQKRHSLTLKESAVLEYSFSKRLTLDELIGRYRILTDFLIVITDSEYCVGWPAISFGDDNRVYQLYFWRRENTESAPGTFDCWPTFNQVRRNLGEIFERWKEQRDILGSAIYLYLGQRRGQPIYLENRFVNLVWGLESFHRAKYPVRQNSAKLEEKINRILNGIGDKKDRNWLAGRLTHANEPALETRILDIIESLPLDLNKRGCRQFAKDCAARRNELSHFGGQRQSSAYNDFLIDLHKKSDALQYLYHTLLLQNLGLDTQIVRNYIYGSNRSFRKKSALVDVGLLDKGVLKVPALPVPNRKAALPEKRAAGKRQTSPAPNKR